MDKLRAIQYFVAAAREGSLSGAARHFEVSVPAVAKLINALERQLGARLFDRSPHGLVLTADGDRYLETCEPLLQTLMHAEERMTGTVEQPRGVVVLEAPPLMTRQCIVPALPAFHRRYPDIHIDLRMIDRLSVTDAETAGLDVIILLGWPDAVDLVSRRIAQMRLLVCATPAYWAEHGIPQRPKDLESHNAFLVRTPRGVLLDFWRYRRGDEEEAAKLSGWMVSDHRDAVLNAVLTGEGIGRFADLSIVNQLECGELVPVLQDWETPDSPPVNLLYRPIHQSTLRVRIVVNFLEALFAELEATRRDGADTSVGAERPAWYRRPYGRASATRPKPKSPTM